MERMGYTCKATKPWLGVSGEEICTAKTEDVKVVLRGATNVWFADTRSSISIPVDDEKTRRKIVGILNKWFDTINASRVDGKLNPSFIEMIAVNEGVNAKELYKHLRTELIIFSREMI